VPVYVQFAHNKARPSLYQQIVDYIFCIFSISDRLGDKVIRVALMAALCIGVKEIKN